MHKLFSIGGRKNSEIRSLGIDGKRNKDAKKPYAAFSHPCSFFQIYSRLGTSFPLFFQLHQCDHDILCSHFRFALYDVLNLGALRIGNAGSVDDDVNLAAGNADNRIGEAFAIRRVSAAFSFSDTAVMSIIS